MIQVLYDLRTLEPCYGQLQINSSLQGASYPNTVKSIIPIPIRAMLLIWLHLFASLASEAQIQVTDSDISVVAPGATVQLTGSSLTNVESVSLLRKYNQYTTTSVSAIDDSTLDFIVPSIPSSNNGFVILVEGGLSATVGIGSDFGEHSSVGGYSTNPPPEYLVIKSGGVLTSVPETRVIYVEAGGVMEYVINPDAIEMVFVEDGGVIDFTRYTYPDLSIPMAVYVSPGATVVGDVPYGAFIRQVASLSPSYAIEPFWLGYPINVTVVGNGAVTKSPDQQYYLPNTLVTLTAAPGLNASFSGWSGQTTSTSNPLGKTIGSSAINLTATFASGWLLDVVEIPGVSISVLPDLSLYPDGAEVELTATVSPGYEFLGWAMDASGAGLDAMLVMDENKTVMPVVRKSVYSQLVQISSVDNYLVGAGFDVELSGSNMDDVTGVSLVYEYQIRESPSLEIADASSLTFEVPAQLNQYNPSILFVQGSLGATVGIGDNFANYVNGVGFTPTLEGDEEFIVVKSGSQLHYTPEASAIYVESGALFSISYHDGLMHSIFAEDGAVINFEKYNYPEYEFVTLYHTQDTLFLGTPPYGLNLVEVPAMRPSYGIEGFERGYAVNVNIVGQGSVSAAPDQPFYSYGSQVTLTATPAANYFFQGWGVSANIPNNPYVVQFNSYSDINLIANFSQGWSLQIIDIPGITVTPNPDLASYPDGSIVTLGIEVESGYEFLGWGLDITGSSQSPQITMDESKRVLPIVRRSGYDNLPQIDDAERSTIGPGELITLTGSNLTGIDSIYLTSEWRRYASSVVQVYNATELDFEVPDAPASNRGYFFIAEGPNGSTVGIGSSYIEFTGSETLAEPLPPVVVVKAGSQLPYIPSTEGIYIESGGFLTISPNDGLLGSIFAEDGAVIDFSSYELPEFEYLTIYHTKDTVFLGEIPYGVTFREVSQIRPSYDLEPFKIGFALSISIDGPGTVTIDPEKTFYDANEVVTASATPYAGAYFIRWVGGRSSRSTSIQIYMDRKQTFIARFSTAPDYFTTWRIVHFTTAELADPSISGLDADPDGDFISNAAEYAFGTDPHVASSKKPNKIRIQMVDGERRWVFGYIRPINALDVNYRVLLSTGFVNWDENFDGVSLLVSRELSVEDIGDGMEEVQVELFPDAEVIPQKFFVKLTADIL